MMRTARFYVLKKKLDEVLEDYTGDQNMPTTRISLNLKKYAHLDDAGIDRQLRITTAVVEWLGRRKEDMNR